MSHPLACEDISLTTPDQRSLPATLFLPEQSNGLSVQINSATLTPRGYYKAFAGFLAERGFTVLTYDCRAMVVQGRALRDEKSGVLDWGTHDQLAATEWLRNRFPDLRLTLVAHSLGGQILGLSPRASAPQAILMVATAHGYWRNWPWRQRLQMLVQNHLLKPLQIALFGYVPKGMGPGLPLSARAARDFSRFQHHPAFFCDEAGNALRPYNDDIRVPLRHITFSDDEVVHPGTEIDLAMFYPQAVRRHDRMTPADYGMERVGHFGFFRRSMSRAAWEDAAAWLQQSTVA